jgi:predicted nucleic acid-binding protein
MNSAVVDTNVLIAFLERGGVEARVLGRFDKLIVPAAVDAEFRSGLDLTTKTGRRLAQILDGFLADQSVVYAPADRPESLKYAMLYRVLKKQGTPIPINDIWIASAALVRNVPLCTFDRHFRKVPLLDVVEIPNPLRCNT